MICHFLQWNTAGNLESKSWMRWVVGVENLMLLNCKHNLHGFIWLFWFPTLSTAFIGFCLIIKATFCTTMCGFWL